jgi:hypothetical protein
MSERSNIRAWRKQGWRDERKSEAITSWRTSECRTFFSSSSGVLGRIRIPFKRLTSMIWDCDVEAARTTTGRKRRRGGMIFSSDDNLTVPFGTQCPNPILCMSIILLYCACRVVSCSPHEQIVGTRIGTDRDGSGWIGDWVMESWVDNEMRSVGELGGRA